MRGIIFRGFMVTRYISGKCELLGCIFLMGFDLVRRWVDVLNS